MNTTTTLSLSLILGFAALTGCEKKQDANNLNSNDTTTNTMPRTTTTPNTTTPNTTTGMTTPPRNADGTLPAPDNSANNRTDRNNDTKTPIDQSQASEDIKITADIRRAIMDDETMSVNAQNCKIITEKGGMVTLRGVVNTQAEKDAIESKAKLVAGVTRVNNQLEVKTN